MPNGNQQIILEGGKLIRSRELNLMFSRLFSGTFAQKLQIWSVATRPDDPEQHRTFGFNVDFRSMEIYMGAHPTPTSGDGWLLIGGIWTVDPDPGAPNNLAVGSRGFNLTEEAAKLWNGVEWVFSA